MQIYGMSDIGLIRESNQDVFYCYKINDDFCFAFVCDGMGGQNGGDVASNMVLEFFTRVIPRELERDINEDEIKKLIFSCYEEINKNIYDMSRSSDFLKGMGTTCSLVVIKNNVMMIFSVGDSRVYIKKDKDLKQLTVDHSYVQTLVDCGEITKEEAKTHPRKNEITNAVGILEEIKIDYRYIEVEKNDLVLLCSDGLTNHCSDKVISDIIEKEEDIKDSVKKLIEVSNFNGGKDNITVVLIKV